MKIDFFKSSVVLSLIAGFKAILGLVSQIIIAYKFGTSRSLDVYFIVLAFPSVIIGILMAMFSSHFVPNLTQIKDDHEKLKGAVSSTLFYTFIIAILLGLFGVILGRNILNATTNLSSQDMLIAGNIVIVIWLIVAVQTINNFLISLYHLHKVFVFPAIIFFFPVVGMIIGALLFSHRIGVLAIAVGWLGMDILACVLLTGVLFKHRLFSFTKINLTDEHVIRFLKNIAPIVISILPFTILPFIDAYWCSSLASGSMSYVGYSTRIVNAIAVIVTTGVYTVILPHLSENIKNNQHQKFFDNLQFSMKGVAFILFPIVGFCLVFRQPILAVLLQRGRFDEVSTHAIGNILPFYLFGMFAMCLSVLINRAYFAKKSVVRLGVISVILIPVYFAISGCLSRFLSYKGIGIAYMVYWILFFFVTTLCFDRSILDRPFLKYMGKLAIASVLATTIGWLIYPVVKSFSLFGGIAICSALTFFAFYIMNAYIFRTFQPFKLRGRKAHDCQ